MLLSLNIQKAAVIMLLLPLQLLAQDDFSIIRKNIVENLQAEITDTAILKQVISYQPQQAANGSWNDINYYDSAIAQWKPGTHLDRLKTFAIAISKPGNFYFENIGLQVAIITGLRYWYRQDPQSKNWWHNEIASPQSLGEIMLLLQQAGNVLPKSLQDSLVNRMKRGDAYIKTGANKLDIAIHYLYRACITKNTALMDSAASQAFQPISFTTEEGLQYDYSYLQHGPQLQISSYGLVFITGAYKVASWLKGTAFALSGEKLKLLNNYFTQTFLKTIRGRYIDFNTEGRGVSRPGILDKYALADKKNAHSIIHLAKEVNPASTQLLDAAALRITETAAPGYAILPEHISFWKADYTVHLRKEYSFNVRTVSNRTKRTEAGNKENLLGKFLPDGSTNIQRTGAEYYNIMPVWEWDKIPGITSRDFRDDQPITVQWGESGSTSFVGGVSDSVYGVTAYAMHYNEVEAKKSYFFFDKEVVCLGAGISSSSAENIITTINQCWLKGKIKAAINGKTEETKKIKECINPSWVWHDSIAYILLQPSTIAVGYQKQTGSWAKINASRQKEEVEGNVFNLWLNHGAKPADSSYAYYVVPGIGLHEMDAYKNNLKVITNSSAVQAVKHNGLNMLQIVFYKAGTVNDSDFSVSVDKPCVVLIKNSNCKNVSVHVADPSQKASSVTITLKSPLLNEEKKLNCILPAGNFAGSSAGFIIN